MITHIHHINFVVRDMELAIQRYQALLDCGEFTHDELAERSVKTARTKLGETWLILVQPLDAHSIPAKHLRDHGEGFFLLSLACNDIEFEQQRIEQHPDLDFPTPVRTGLDEWRVRDLSIECLFGAQVQLTQEKSNSTKTTTSTTSIKEGEINS